MLKLEPTFLITIWRQNAQINYKVGGGGDPKLRIWCNNWVENAKSGGLQLPTISDKQVCNKNHLRAKVNSYC